VEQGRLRIGRARTPRTGGKGRPDARRARTGPSPRLGKRGARADIPGMPPPSSASTPAVHAGSRVADVVICGAGIAGIAAAHALAVGHGIRRVVLVDEGAPLSLTSDKSTEAYRNWWPAGDDAMLRYMNRSIDLFEAMAERSGNRILLNRRGYLYATADPAVAEAMVDEGALAEAQGAGPLRVRRSVAAASDYQPSTHTGWQGHPDGADLFLDPDAIRRHFPFLADDIVGVLHTRRCGWFSGQQVGMLLLEEAKAAGATLVAGRVAAVHTTGGAVRGVRVETPGAGTIDIATPAFVNAAGPHARAVGRLAGVELPLVSELHRKVAFEDVATVVPRDTGLVILRDHQQLPWTDEERAELAADDETRWLTEPMPSNVHCRPEGYHGSRTVLMLWECHGPQLFDPPAFPIPDDPVYAEVVFRGMARLVPGLARYLDALPHSCVDGGYYTKTVENRPLIGPMPVGGAYICAAFSGFGLMAAPAGAELLAAHVAGASLPSYAPAFLLARYDDPAYRQRLADWGSTGQL
jgi:glycine/D-amino acid oxidase-like deaminating enzyme